MCVFEALDMVEGENYMHVDFRFDVTKQKNTRWVYPPPS